MPITFAMKKILFLQKGCEMKRIMVIGCCGAGKSTFSKRLQNKTQLPLIHLDQQFWLPNWTEPNKKQWAEKVRELAAKPSWIIDGNYNGTIDIRLKQAEAVILLDKPTWICLYRVMKRIVQYYDKVRPDMPEGCKERWDWPFLKYVAFFNLTRRPKLLRKLAGLNSNQSLFILKKQKEIESFLIEKNSFDD